MKGKHSFCGRGILFDHLYASEDANTDGIFIGDAIWNQAATTPTVMFWVSSSSASICGTF